MSIETDIAKIAQQEAVSCLISSEPSLAMTPYWLSRALQLEARLSSGSFATFLPERCARAALVRQLRNET